MHAGEVHTKSLSPNQKESRRSFLFFSFPFWHCRLLEGDEEEGEEEEEDHHLGFWLSGRERRREG